MDSTKYFGKVYTPTNIVNQMLDTLFDESLADIRICDPACGSGDFLVPIAEKICRCLLSDSPAKSSLYLSTLSVLTGYDIDGEAVDRCRQRLTGVAGQILGQYYPL